MFCDHSRLRRRHKTAGQDVSLEYRRRARAFHQAQPDTRNFVRTKFFCHLDGGQDSQSDSFCIHRKLPRLAAWPTPYGRTVNCAPVHRYQIP